MPTLPDDVLTAVERLEPALSGLAGEVAAQVRQDVPALDRLAPAAVTGFLVTLNTAALDGIRRGAGPTSAQLAEIESEVVLRAELGVSVEDVLAGLHRGKQASVDAVLAELGPGVQADDATTFLRFVEDWVEVVRRHVLVVHRQAELRLARSGRDQSNALLRGLLAAGDEAALAELRDHGIAPDADVHLLCARPATGEPAWVLESVLTAALTPSLSGYLDGSVVVLAQAPPPDAPPGRRVAWAGPVCCDELAEVYPLLLAALDLSVGKGLVGLHTVAAQVARNSQPLLGRLLVRRLLTGLDPRVADHVQLVRTVESYLAHTGRFDRTAADLCVHVNTVKHRLARFAGLTGTSASDDRESLLWAARNWLARTA